MTTRKTRPAKTATHKVAANSTAGRIITPEAWREQPWNNGRGVTQEVIRWPAGPADAPYDVRVSVVDLTEPMPFSTFPGYHRWIIPARGEIHLRSSRTTYAVSSRGGFFDAFKFDGAKPMSVELPTGPTRVVNIIARPEVVAVGTSVSHWKMRFVLALDEPNELGLPRWHAKILEPRASVMGPFAWLYWLDWRKDPYQPARRSKRA